MHAFILLVIAFWSPIPGDPTHATETAHAGSAVFASHEACDAVGQASVSQILQSKFVSHASYVCLETVNPEDKQA